MSNPIKRLSQSRDVSAKVARIAQTRTKLALERFTERVQQASTKQVIAQSTPKPMSPLETWTSGAQYAVDFTQRSILLWDTLRQRGN
ncbi:MAG TPA: poly(3-hydroxybutyrate) depolymerase, partial [Burkholderiaceae bacterium]|nr:poly(3-hydroxybutyrate) depolymerase [Burkholderiaceae bacterium]